MSLMDDLRLENAKLRRTIIELQTEVLRHQHRQISAEIAAMTPKPEAAQSIGDPVAPDPDLSAATGV